MTEGFPIEARRTRLRSRWPLLLGGVLVGVAVGGAAVVGLVLSGDVDVARLAHGRLAPAAATAPHPPAVVIATPPSSLADSVNEARVGALEQRLGRLEMESAAASANATRAEALLVAFAARRVVERGAQLGYLEDQLRLRFGDAQPRAVTTIITNARTPVTLDWLTARLDMMGDRLAHPPADASLWQRITREFNGLFVLRREGSTTTPDPMLRLEHARLCLREGRVDDAIADVQRLPGAASAQDWVTAAHHYADTLAALDQIETTALLEPRALRDGAGRVVNGTGPSVAPVAVGTPAPAASPSPAPTATPAAPEN